MSETQKYTYEVGEFDIPRIMEKIPHRAPLLLVDRVNEIETFTSKQLNL